MLGCLDDTFNGANATGTHVVTIDVALLLLLVERGKAAVEKRPNANLMMS